MAGAALLGGARARDAFEASLDPQHGGVLIAISHEAGTAATLAAMRAAAANGARTILITARPRSTPAPTSRSARRSSTRPGATRSATSRRCSR